MRRHKHLERPLLGRGVAAIVVALAAGAVLVNIFAATYTAPSETESAARSGPVTICKDTNASGGQALKFGAWNCGAASRMFTNSVKPSTADPGVLAYDGKYYMVSTAGTPSFAIFVSTDLVNWTWTGKSVFDGTHPWGLDQFWAPELHRLKDGSFICNYSARAKDGTGAHIGIAYAPDITGPFTDLGRPIVKASYNSIDTTFLLNDDGKMYLYWKEDDGNTPIWGQQMSDDGRSLVGSPVVVLQKGLSWEGAKGIEGPYLWKHNGTYYMFYSGGLYLADDYAVGVAKSASPLAPYTKRGAAILTTGNRWRGPGHNSVTTIGNSDWMVYHAWDGTAGVGDRWGMIDKITWGADGWPTVANGHPTEGAQPYPY